MSAPILKLSCVIRECDVDGWDIISPTYKPIHAESAADALKQACGMVQALDFSSILTITWEPRTPIGRRVVKVITS